MTKTREYEAWIAMRARCTNAKLKGYKNYGGRGITVCEDWMVSFERFLEDMGPRLDGTSLDRIDNEGNYEPNNCRWATPLQQAQNRRRQCAYARHKPKGTTCSRCPNPRRPGGSYCKDCHAAYSREQRALRKLELEQLRAIALRHSPELIPPISN